MKFIVAVLFLTFSLFFLAFFFFEGREEGVVEVSPSLDVVEVVEVSPSLDLVEVEGGYEYGFRRGRASFLSQMGEDVEVPVSARYVVDGHWSEDEVGRGYVDGYHRASETYSCPRVCR